MVRIAWGAEADVGHVLPGGHLNVRLQTVAEAQVWTGDAFGVLWEGYYLGSRRNVQRQAELADFWRTVEADMRVAKFFTLPADPAFVEGYTDFRRELGYGPNADHSSWWSREMMR